MLNKKQKNFNSKQNFSFGLDPLKDPHICGRPQCEFDNTKFNYTTNVRYVYDYNSHIKSQFNGSGQDTSDIYVSGTVLLTFPKKCEGILRIMDIELREHTLEEEAAFVTDEYGELPKNLHANSAEFAADIQKYDLR